MKEKFVTALNAIHEYLRFFDEHRVYISEQLCTSLEEFGKQLREPTIRLGVNLECEYPNDQTAKDRLKAWTAAWESAEKEVPRLRSALEAEIRVLLGVIDVRPS